MSLIKIKNAAVKAAAAALATHCGRPVKVEGSKEGSRVSLHIGEIGKPIYQPTCYSFYEGGHSFKIHLFGPEQRTPEAVEAVRIAKAAAEAVLPTFGASGNINVRFGTGCDREQIEALRAHWRATGEQPEDTAKKLAAPVAA